MKTSPQPATRRRYDAAFRAETLRLAGESRSTQAAARALNISPKLLYKWQKEAMTPVAARCPRRGVRSGHGGGAAPAAGLGAAAGTGVGYFKKAITIFSQTPNQ